MRDLDWLGDGPTMRAWYPAEPDAEGGSPPYLPADQLANLGVSASDDADIEMAAVVNAPPAAGIGPLPTVLFVPFNDLGTFSTVLMQELASRGYLVVLAQPSVNLPDANEEQANAERARMGTIVDRLVAGTDGGSIGTADTARLAVGGHSAGGSFAFEMALVDPRVRAVFDLDGALVRQASTQAVAVPALVVLTSLGLGGHRDVFPETFSILASTPTATVVGLIDADHFDVLDAPTVAPALPGLTSGWPLGPIGATATTSTAELVARFLDGALSGDNATPSAAELVDGVAGTTADTDFAQLG